MKIIVEDREGKEILNGKFCFLEGGILGEKFTFNIELYGGGWIQFYCEKKEELDEFIEILQGIKTEKFSKKN